MSTLLLLGSLWTGSALAQTAEVDFAPPAEVKLFSSIQFINGVGRVAGADCGEAFRAGLADAQRVADDRTHGVIVAVYDDKPAPGWAIPATLPCAQKGNPPKTSVVKVEALAVRPGTSAAYPTITGARAVEIADALVVDGSVMGMQLSRIDLEDHNGAVYYATTSEAREEVFAADDSRNTRGVTVFRESITPRLASLVELVGPVPEIQGLHVRASAKRYEKGEEATETFHLYVPVSAAKDFVAGKLSEQQLVDAGAVMHDEGKAPVRMDISFVDAED